MILDEYFEALRAFLVEHPHLSEVMASPCECGTCLARQEEAKAAWRAWLARRRDETSAGGGES